MGADVETVVGFLTVTEKQMREFAIIGWKEGAYTLRISAHLANTDMGKLYRGQGEGTPGVWGGCTGFGPRTADMDLCAKYRIQNTGTKKTSLKLF